MPTDPELEPGTTLGDFCVERLIGSGGMGHVYLARQASLQRRVALKTLRPELTQNPQSLERFLREGRAVARLTHAHIVQVYSIGEQAGIHYMALEYVEGRNLRDLIDRKGPPDLAQTVGILRAVTQALIRAHESGFVHRDIKPENILISKKGEVKVADFGLSRAAAVSDDVPPSLTRSGVTMGTPLYMSPEQVRGHTADARSDLYSLGVTAYHMLAGEPPFKGQTAFDVAMCHVQSEPAPLAALRPDAPPDLIAVVTKLMQKAPERRYQSGRELLQDLSAVKAQILAGVTAPQTVSIPAAPTLGQTTGGLTPIAAPRWGLWLGIGLAFSCAAGVGAAVKWSRVPPAVAIEMDPENDLRNERADDPEPTLRQKLADPAVRWDAKQNLTLDLGLLLVSRKQFDKAQAAFDDFAKVSPGPDNDKKGPLLAKAVADVVAGAGRVIVLSAQNQWEASNAALIELVTPKKLPEKAARQRALEVIGRQPWRKALVDAAIRNARNAPPDSAIDDRLKPYLSYMPQGPGEK